MQIFYLRKINFTPPIRLAMKLFRMTHVIATSIYIGKKHVSEYSIVISNTKFSTKQFPVFEKYEDCYLYTVVNFGGDL